MKIDEQAILEHVYANGIAESDHYGKETASKDRDLGINWPFYCLGSEMLINF